ncbi:splicing factor 3B subunit 4-like [Uranotaenia lowii]|uniref:splicing factor 3B subunit 4-like n=1 Tax=Uranotaenia lowii TaxID=190385 RepID=UPI00247872A0|nr:splicing factor 3B subunit 4-like [Uranotaenia lowii]
MYREEFCLFIKFETKNLMENALKKLGQSVAFIYADNTNVKVDVTEANGSIKYVRVLGLPPEVDDKQLTAVFSQYGDIKQIVRERYPAELGFPIWNGVRGLHIELRGEIPTQVFVQSFKSRVYYEGMVNKCFTCGSKEHLKVNCPARNTMNRRLGSYAHPTTSDRAGILHQQTVEKPEDKTSFPELTESTENKQELGGSGTKHQLTRTEPLKPTGKPKRNRVAKTESESSEEGKAKKIHGGAGNYIFNKAARETIALVDNEENQEQQQQERQQQQQQQQHQQHWCLQE